MGCSPVGGLQTGEGTAMASKASNEQLMIAAIKKDMPAAQERLFGALADHLFTHVHNSDLDQLPPALAQGMLRTLWQDFCQGADGQSCVNVYDIDLPFAHGVGRVVINMIQDNRTFAVESVMAYLRHKGLRARVLMAPIVSVKCDAQGQIEEILPAPSTEAGTREVSIIHCQLGLTMSPEEMEALRQDFQQIQQDVVNATQDWQAMRARAQEAQGACDPHAPHKGAQCSEIQAFLQWLMDDHFTFLGYRYFDCAIETRKKSAASREGLGILSGKTLQEICTLYHGISAPSDLRKFFNHSEALLISKCTRVSTVHRAVPLDSISIKHYDGAGHLLGIHQFIGLFTSIAYSASARYIPLLRERVRAVAQQAGYQPTWYDGKALLQILDTLPRDELFQSSVPELVEIGKKVLTLAERPRVVASIRVDILDRFLSCIVYVPEDWFDYDLIAQMGQALSQDIGVSAVVRAAEYGTHPFARVQYLLPLEGKQKPLWDLKSIEQNLTKIARPWGDDLRSLLQSAHGEMQGQALWAAYGDAFDKGYQSRFSALNAMRDLDAIEKTLAQTVPCVRLYRLPQDPDYALRLKLYCRGSALPLSDVVPILENMGLRVLNEMSYTVTPATAPEGADQTVFLHDFSMHSADASAADLETLQESFAGLFLGVWSGQIENDIYNALLLRAGLQGQSCLMLRAYSKYLRQVQIPFSHDYMGQTLIKNAPITRALEQFFVQKFDPAPHQDDPHATVDQIQKMLESVENPDEDRILRRFLNLMLSTLRTSFFQHSSMRQIAPYLSFKFNAQMIDELPLPRPKFEIFVYAADFEAVHLRGGKVARGGIRWSDRREDFRTEILGLLKAQMVKNAVIVPGGSKGGFVLKAPTDGLVGPALRTVALGCYQKMMHALLEITDNRVGGAIVTPPKTRLYDENDAYLVVAADKGTASFSDAANQVSQEKGFWLADAFASGGSQGYDHKAMGITARGAWESARAHLGSLGIDPQKQTFTVVGIGDMSGDVFGNGMLLSDKIILQGAFNHQHIFIDPTPDAAASYTQRQHCFQAQNGWGDYDLETLSPGGRIFERSAKMLHLTPEIRAFLGVPATSMTPADVMRALLKVPVDLMWFGGIGTYVKDATESHAQVGDHANDGVRVNGAELRCRVVVEGANLGVTQLGRITYARAGGLINTDALDNSGGVDCSDHEVNIKILLQGVQETGALSSTDRNKLLREMTPEVSELVLAHNRQQNLAVTLCEARGMRALEPFSHFLRKIEREGRLDRGVEFLPDDAQIESYRIAGTGFSRPELCVILAYAKNTLCEDLLVTDLPQESFLQPLLQAYFPQALQLNYPAFIARHPLRREIITTRLVNDVINRMGPEFVVNTAARTNRSDDEVVRAYVTVTAAYNVDALWQALVETSDIEPAVRLEALGGLAKLIGRLTVWVLRHAAESIDVAQIHALLAQDMQQFQEILQEDSALQEMYGAAYTHYIQMDLPEGIASRMAALKLASRCLDVSVLARTHEVSLREALGIYFAVDSHFSISRLREEAEELLGLHDWEFQAATAVLEDMARFHKQMTGYLLRVCRARGTSGQMPSSLEIVRAWCASHMLICRGFEQALARAQGDLRHLPVLVVLSRELVLLAQAAESTLTSAGIASLR